MNRSLLVLALLASPSLVFAATWQPSAELGIVNTTGNSETTSINGRFGLKAEEDLWSHDYYLAALRSENDDELTANRYELGAKSDRKLGERSYLGAAARYENDDFSPYDYQATLALNYGGWLLREEGRSFKLEGGPGVRRARLAERSRRRLHRLRRQHCRGHRSRNSCDRGRRRGGRRGHGRRVCRRGGIDRQAEVEPLYLPGQFTERRPDRPPGPLRQLQGQPHHVLCWAVREQLVQPGANGLASAHVCRGENLTARWAQGIATIEPDPARIADFNARVQAALQETVWNRGGCRSYFIDRNGRKLTADRPIPECLDREQRELGGLTRRPCPRPARATAAARSDAAPAPAARAATHHSGSSRHQRHCRAASSARPRRHGRAG